VDRHGRVGKRRRRGASLWALLWAMVLVVLAGAPMSGCMPPSWASGSVLYPSRRPVKKSPLLDHRDVELQVDDMQLKGWLFPATGARRGTVIYLHGFSENRSQSLDVVPHLVSQGLDVLAYDSRGHGESEGETCTYGYHERGDVLRAIDSLEPGPVVLMGISLGAAVALQAAAEDPRVTAVVALATFSDLETIVAERAPWFASQGNVSRTLEQVESKGAFPVAEASPVAAAAEIQAPVLLIHGADDRKIHPAHSQLVYDALTSRKRLIVIPGARHLVLLDDALWREIDDWIDLALAEEIGDRQAHAP
jgi:uncharacterized protein